MVKIGLISDTHDRLNPKVLELFKECQYIIHAGDVSHPSVLERLRQVAPVTCVRGNCDFGPWADELPSRITQVFAGVQIQVIHNSQYVRLHPDTKIVIYGHTHRARQYWGCDVLYINPGSASEPRDGLHGKVAILTLDGERIEIENYTL